jgi:uracil-DNA glycosylase
MPWAEAQRAMLCEMGLGAALPPAVLPAAPAQGPAARGAVQPPATTARPRSPAPGGTTARPLGPSSESLGTLADRSMQGAAEVAAPMTVFLARPPAQAHAATDWLPLRQAVADCRACELCQTRKQTVFGVGHPRAHWMVVGEAPGAQEDEQGEPFVGAAGQLLDAMLRALQLSRAAEGEPARSVYIANTLKCRPPGNRNPLPQEMERCEPFLARQIELVQPRIILAMGRFAVNALLRSNEPIGKLRRQVHEYRGVPLVVTYHPAYLLRNLPDKARAWEDLCLAADQLER